MFFFIHFFFPWMLVIFSCFFTSIANSGCILDIVDAWLLKLWILLSSFSFWAIILCHWVLWNIPHFCINQKFKDVKRVYTQILEPFTVTPLSEHLSSSFQLFFCVSFVLQHLRVVHCRFLLDFQMSCITSKKNLHPWSFHLLQLHSLKIPQFLPFFSVSECLQICIF